MSDAEIREDVELRYDEMNDKEKESIHDNESFVDWVDEGDHPFPQEYIFKYTRFQSRMTWVWRRKNGPTL